MKGPLIKSGEQEQGQLMLLLIRPDKAGAGARCARSHSPSCPTAPGWQHGQVLTGCVALGATYLPPAPVRLRVAPSIPWNWGESWVTAPGSAALLEWFCEMDTP